MRTTRRVRTPRMRGFAPGQRSQVLVNRNCSSHIHVMRTAARRARIARILIEAPSNTCDYLPAILCRYNEVTLRIAAKGRLMAQDSTPSGTPDITAEDQRLRSSGQREIHWKRWGPYLSERQWGTVRE